MDTPEMAVSTRYSLLPGDLVLLATDGLFDNMPESMLLKILNGLKERGQRDLLEGASKVVEKARELSLNASFQSPFALKAREHNVPYSGGGKPDDITLILASVPFYYWYFIFGTVFQKQTHKSQLDSVTSRRNIFKIPVLEVG